MEIRVKISLISIFLFCHVFYYEFIKGPTPILPNPTLNN